MSIINSGFKVGEQVDGSLIYPSGDIILPEQREIIISNSLNTPVRGSESDIKNIIKNASCSILIGETGSGKTTELAQMIHEVYPEDLIITNIPLVAATIGTGSYVSDIMFAKTGNPYYTLGQGGVGYRTGKGVSEEKRAQITFNTYGLDYLNLSLGNFEKFLNSSSKNIHVVLDEIHEKGEDFVFYLSKILEFSNKYPGRVKLYGASATLSDNYLDLLVDKFKGITKEVPITKVDGRTFPINTLENNGGDIVKEVCSYYNDGKSILAFLPGKAEINKTIAEIQKVLGDKIEIYPFHSEVSSDELRKSLESSENQKIYVATNAARTGVTLDINVVADSGVQKNQYYNEYGIPVLVGESITQDAYHQNKGRAGRKEEGDAIYLGHKLLSELDEEAPSSVEIKVDEKKILMELIDNRNILKNENKGIHNYLFNPNKRMLGFSYDWMKSCGLITSDEKITKYGFDVLKLPLSVFNARIILEAIENNIADELVTIVSIIENKGFIKRNFNIDKFKNGLFDTSTTDLDLYKKLFDILSSTEIDDDILNVFENMGIERSLINYFKSIKGEEKFYKVIGDKLEEIGLKFKNIERIDDTIEKIKKFLNNNQDYLNSTYLDITDDELKELISRCLLSGNLHKIYRATGSDSLIDYNGEQGELSFEKSDTSFVNINNGSIYIGEPFIIGGAGDKEDLPILSLLTIIDEKGIDFFMNKIYEEYIPRKGIVKTNDFSIDEGGDTFDTHGTVIDEIEKQKYLSQNWLPFFLIEKNPFFKEFIKNFNGDFNKDTFVQLLQTHTIKYSSKIDPYNKDKSIDLFEEDTSILEGFIKSKNVTIKKFLNGEKIEKIKQKKVEGKKTDFLQLIESQTEYNKTLNEVNEYLKSYGLDIDNLQEGILDEFINQLEENSEGYSRLIIFLKKLNKVKGNNSKKLEIKSEFKSFKSALEQILKMSKRNSWIESLIENLEGLINGDDISLKELEFGIISDNDLLISSPLIRKNNLLDDINFSARKLLSIKKSIKKIGLKGKKYSKLLISLQKLLFVNQGAYTIGLRHVNKHIGELKTMIKKNIYAIKLLSDQKIGGNPEEINKMIKRLNITNSSIFTVIKMIDLYKKSILDIRGKIDNIDFNNINYNSEYTNGIYTKKFLYNLIIKNIFVGDFVALTDYKNEKLRDKLKLYVGCNNSDMEELIILIKNVINLNEKRTLGEEVKGKKKEKDNNAIISLKNHVISLKEGLIQYELEKQSSITNIEGNEFKNVNLLILNLKKILLEFYDEDIINVNEKKIFLFASKIHNLNINNFDNYLKKFILTFSGISNIRGTLFENIDRYISLNDDISNYGISEKIKKSDLLESDIIKLRENKINIENINKSINDINIKFQLFITEYIEIINHHSGYTEKEITDYIIALNDVLNMYINDQLNPQNIDSNFNITLFEGYMNIFHELKGIEGLDFIYDKLDSFIDGFTNILLNIKGLIANKDYIDFEKSNLSGYIDKYSKDTEVLKSKTIEIKNIIDFFKNK